MRTSNWRVTCWMVALCVWLCVTPVPAQDSELVTIPDENLKAAIMDTLGLWSDPTHEDMRWMTSLHYALAGMPDREDRWITDLTGLEAAVNLWSLNLRYNHVTDVTPLQGLTQLTKLNLSENQLSDLSGVATLTQVMILDVHHNGITDLTPLSGMTQLWSLILRDNDYQGSLEPLSGLTRLEHLDLEHNDIQDLDDLRNVTRLKDLRLAYNQITDVSVLAHMTKLEILDLRHNVISDISALTGLTRLKRLYLGGNPLGTEAYTDLQTIQANNPGMDLEYDVPNQPGVFTFTVTSSDGGSVTTPGEGSYGPYTGVTPVEIEATPDPGYVFVDWTGAAVDAGKVADPNTPNTLVIVDGSYTVTANFTTDVPGLQSLYLVDDDAAADPLPGDPTESDALEDGSVDHPFDAIQEAIDVAQDGDVIQVLPGTYFENIDFLGKAIEVVGMEPNDPYTGDLPILYGLGEDPTVRMTDTVPGLGAVLKGMAVVGAKGAQAGAIECIGGQPTLINCLVTGNYTSDTGGGALFVVDCNLVVMNSTIAHNSSGPLGGALVLENSQVHLQDSIVWGNSPLGIAADANSTVTAEFCDLQEPESGQGNVTTDPMFVARGDWVYPQFHFIIMSPEDPESIWLPGDYQLKSQQGHWDSETLAFVADDVTSPCIDAGSHLLPIGQETDPNGQRLNQGVYGGTRFASQSYSESLTMPDDNLKNAIMQALGIWWEPTKEDLRWVTSLDLKLPGTVEQRERPIRDLTGLESAVNLWSLNLRYNQVTDVSPLKSLTQLTRLNLSENKLNDLSGVATLTQVMILDVHHNGISDLTPLAGMTQLLSLTLRDNEYEGSLEPLSGLTRLEHLDLERNRIQDLTELKDLTSLKDLRLFSNQITDVSLLANMTELEILDLRRNAISDISPLTGLTKLKKLYLEENPLNAQAVIHLQIIKTNNPDCELTYDG